MYCCFCACSVRLVCLASGKTARAFLSSPCIPLLEATMSRPPARPKLLVAKHLAVLAKHSTPPAPVSKAAVTVRPPPLAKLNTPPPKLTLPKTAATVLKAPPPVAASTSALALVPASRGENPCLGHRISRNSNCVLFSFFFNQPYPNFIQACVAWRVHRRRRCGGAEGRQSCAWGREQTSTKQSWRAPPQRRKVFVLLLMYRTCPRARAENCYSFTLK